jgi:hypothetical protein
MQAPYDVVLSERDICLALEAYLNNQLLPQARVQVTGIRGIVRLTAICVPQATDPGPTLAFGTAADPGYTPAAD